MSVKVAQKYAHQFNIESANFHNSLKMLLNFWTTFAGHFVLKNFQKSSNLVTLKPMSSFVRQAFEASAGNNALKY